MSSVADPPRPVIQEMRLYGVGRVVGLDVGERRIGVAISDATRTLARPLGVLQISGLDGNALDVAAVEVTRLASEEDGVTAIVIGLPRRLDGTANDMTPRVDVFAARLGARTALPVALQDERLTSREAESRLAVREKDWRVRKRRLDAAAAAIILQDYLDAHPDLR
jgi:putative Holliday junction resolvase